MKIKTAMIIILLAIVATACINNKTATENKAGQQIQQQAATQNETIPPGTIVQQTTGQIKFNVIPPDDGSNVSI